MDGSTAPLAASNAATSSSVTKTTSQTSQVSGGAFVGQTSGIYSTLPQTLPGATTYFAGQNAPSTIQGATMASTTTAVHPSMAALSSGMGTASMMTTGVETGPETVTSERIMSSTVIGEERLNAAPEDSIQYIEVPVIEEVIRHVPKKEVVEIEKRIPRYEYEWVERIVEVPQVQYVDKHVEVPRYEEVIKHVPVKQYVDVPREVVRYVPKVETKIVEQEVEVVGETIEVPKPYLVENKVVVPRYVDKETPTVVAQRLQPVITESETDFVDVELKEYNPQLIPVDVYIPRPVARNLIAAAKYEEHRVVDVPAAQYNALVKNLNTHISDKDNDAIYVKMSDGSIPMLHGLGASIVPPLSSEWEKYHQKGQSHIVWTAGLIMPGTTAPGGHAGGRVVQQTSSASGQVMSTTAQQMVARGASTTGYYASGLPPGGYTGNFTTSAAGVSGGYATSGIGGGYLGGVTSGGYTTSGISGGTVVNGRYISGTYKTSTTGPGGDASVVTVA